MSTNGSNSWDVSYAHISWFERLLKTHANVTSVQRHDDLVFDLTRKEQGDHLTVFCCNEYTMGLTMVQRAIHEFGKINVIYIGGGWCGYTKQAKAFCIDTNIGLYVTEEMSGALWATAFWSYHRKDKDGNAIYNFRNERC